MAVVTMLAIETSTQACSVALRCVNGTFSDHRLIPRQHNSALLPMIRQILQTAELGLSDLDSICYGSGPGSFTGLRIAVGVVQGLGFGLRLPVVPVSTLACIAQGAFRRHGHEACAVILRARQDEVYFGSYRVEQGVMLAQKPDRLCLRAELQLADRTGLVGVGDAWRDNRQELEQLLGTRMVDIEDDSLPEAQDLFVLADHELLMGRDVDAMNARPSYLRDEVANKIGAS